MNVSDDAPVSDFSRRLGKQIQPYFMNECYKRYAELTVYISTHANNTSRTNVHAQISSEAAIILGRA